jgi:small subunit ribosomal protein S23e
MGKNKPRGLQAARKLRLHRKDQRWADKQYKKRALGTAFKSSPFAGASHAKGIVVEKVYVLADLPFTNLIMNHSFNHSYMLTLCILMI